MIIWLESTSADYRDVVTKIANEGKTIGHSSSIHSHSEESEDHVTTPTEAAAAGAIVTTAEVHLPAVHKEEDDKQPAKTRFFLSSLFSQLISFISYSSRCPAPSCPPYG